MRTTTKVVGFILVILLILYCRYLLRKTNYDPTVVSTIVTGIVAIVVGLIAAYIGAQTTLRATKEAHKNNLELQKQNQKAMLRGVVQAIYAELTSLWDIYHGEFGDDLENLKPGEAFGTYYPLTQDYFTIYSSNSVFIGQLPDSELRHGIVKAYLKAKALIDSHLLNNKLLDELNRHQNADAAALDPFQAAVIAKASDNLKGYGDSVRTTYLETKTAVFHVLELIENSGMLDSKTQARLKTSSPLAKATS